MENIELRNIDDELQHTFNSMPPYFPFTEIIGDWKYEYPQMGNGLWAFIPKRNNPQSFIREEDEVLGIFKNA